MVYIMAGPKYIRTLQTSSLIRFIKSPVCFFYKNLMTVVGIVDRFHFLNQIQSI